MILRTLASLMLALSAMSAAAQTPAPLVLANPPANSAVLPIRDDSNQIQAFLLLEFPKSNRSSLERLLGRPANEIAAGITIPLAANRRLSSQLSLDAQAPMSLLCQGRGIIATLGSLAEHCLLSGLSGSDSAGARLSLSRPGARGEIRLQGAQGQVAASLGLHRYELAPSLNLPGTTASGLRLTSRPLPGSASIEERELGLLGELRVGSEGWLSIGGTWAHARLLSAAELPGALPPQWNQATLSLGAGVGNFGGEVIGQRISLPGQTRDYSSVGVGVTWKTPWRAQLSVGAQNLASRGKNPFALPSSDAAGKDDEGRVPYVRYQQDL